MENSWIARMRAFGLLYWAIWALVAIIWIVILDQLDLSGFDSALVFGLAVMTFTVMTGAHRKKAEEIRQEYSQKESA